MIALLLKSLTWLHGRAVIVDHEEVEKMKTVRMVIADATALLHKEGR